MIDFDKEVNKFKPSLEIDEEDAQKYDNLEDITDIMQEMLKDIKSTSKG